MPTTIKLLLYEHAEVGLLFLCIDGVCRATSLSTVCILYLWTCINIPLFFQLVLCYTICLLCIEWPTFCTHTQSYFIIIKICILSLSCYSLYPWRYSFLFKLFIKCFFCKFVYFWMILGNLVPTMHIQLTYSCLLSIP